MKPTKVKVAALSLATLTLASAAFAADNQCGPALNSRLLTTQSETLLNNSEMYRSLSGHIPRIVKAMNDQGKMSEEQVLPVTLALKLNNEDELNQRIEDMYAPGSATFHQFITPEEFVNRYAPTAEQISNEKAFLESQGIAVQDVSENHVFIHASGTVSALNNAFKTEVHQFVRSNGKQYFAPAYEVQAPVTSRITNVIGLSNTAEFHSHIARSGKKPSDPTPPPAEGTAPGGGLAPADIRTAYNVPSNLDGTGQTLGLFELDGYKAANITAYEKQFGLPATPLKNVLIDSFSGKPADGEVEVELDIELMIALAPKATQILVYEGANSEAGLIDTYTKIATDNLAKQVSSSWGMAESSSAAADMQSENTIFKQMVAQGQTLYSAAGDSGAEDDGSTVSVDDPSGQPYVVAVGGTKMVMSSTAAWQSETTWNELTASEGAGGGGISTVWTIPSWQSGTIKYDTQSSKTMRNLPDVALNADPVTGYGVYFTDTSSSTKPQWAPVGGTSAAAPLWAAFNALVNQNRVAKGLSLTGFINPALYAIGTGSNAASDFHDIADGSNNGNSTGSFKTYKGYDNATGWGSFQATNLLNDLSTDAAPAAPVKKPKK